jgi:hypothetical protein
MTLVADGSERDAVRQQNRRRSDSGTFTLAACDHLPVAGW